MWTLFDIGADLFQAFLMLVFMKSRLHITKQRRLLDIICVLSVTLFFYLHETLSLPIPDTVVFFIPLIYGLVVSDDKFYIPIFWTLVLSIVFMAAASLSLHIFMSIPRGSYADLIVGTSGRLAFVLVTNLVLFLLLYGIAKIKIESSQPNWPTLFLFVSMFVALILVEESVFYLQMDLISDYTVINKAPFFLIYVGILICAALSILLFHMLAQSASRENRYKLEANSMALTQQHMQELKRMYMDLHSLKHDFRHHFQTLEEMVRLGGNVEAASYLADYSERLSRSDIYLTGCIAVDALLTAKYLTMQKKNLKFKLSAYPLNNLPICETDFCSILGNILDNAIEGTLRMSDIQSAQPIHLTFSRSWNMLYIFCTNSCNPDTIQKEKTGWRSSKEKEGISGTHAIGIRNVEKIVDAAEGRCTFTVKDDMFTAKIVLPYPFCEGGDDRC